MPIWPYQFFSILQSDRRSDPIIIFYLFISPDENKVQCKHKQVAGIELLVFVLAVAKWALFSADSFSAARTFCGMKWWWFVSSSLTEDAWWSVLVYSYRPTKAIGTCWKPWRAVVGGWFTAVWDRTSLQRQLRNESLLRLGAVNYVFTLSQ